MRQETGDTRQVEGLKPIRSYRDLEIWQEGVQLVNRIYMLTRGFPREEMYGLTSQMRRAAVSVPSNIAEGYARRHRSELRQFLYIALGSLAELETLVLVCAEQKLIASAETADQTSSFIARLKNKTLAFLRVLR